MVAIRFNRFTLLIVFIALACFASAHELHATESKPTNEQIRTWIAGLGNDSYAQRQAAAEHLTSAGYPVRDALADAANGPDPEIRAAARRILTLIDDNAFTKQLADFAADVDGSRGATLPGWKEFSELVGANAAARAMFVTMHKEEGPLLRSVFDDPQHLAAVDWDAQSSRLFNGQIFNQQGNVAVPVGRCATLLFLGAVPATNMTDNAAISLGRIAQMPPLAESLMPHHGNSAARRLLSAWVVNCPSRNDQALQQRLDLMAQYQLADALPLPLAMLSDPTKHLVVHPALRVAAISTIGKFGAEKHLPVLEQLLDDRSVYFSAPPAAGPHVFMRTVQVRDVALANMLHLTDQEPVTYRFLRVRTHPHWVYEATSLGMENDEQRDAAREQWRAWRAQHPLDRADVR